MIPEVVPLSINKAELMVIPDPRLNTGQAMKGEPTSRPAGDGEEMRMEDRKSWCCYPDPQSNFLGFCIWARHL